MLIDDITGLCQQPATRTQSSVFSTHHIGVVMIHRRLSLVDCTQQKDPHVIELSSNVI